MSICDESNKGYTNSTTDNLIKTPENHTIINIAEQLLNETEKQYKSDDKFSDESLLSLSSIYGDVVLRALDLLENGQFVMYQSNDNLRKILKVRSDKEYTLFHRVNYCKCKSFKYNVLRSRKELTCKHVLAARLAEITGKFEVEIYTPQKIVEILNDQI